MKALILLAVLLLSGCGVRNKLESYESTITTPKATYTVKNKRGAIIQLREPDGTQIVADDSGHPPGKSILGQLVATIKAASDID